MLQEGPWIVSWRNFYLQSRQSFFIETVKPVHRPLRYGNSNRTDEQGHTKKGDDDIGGLRDEQKRGPVNRHFEEFRGGLKADLANPNGFHDQIY